MTRQARCLTIVLALPLAAACAIRAGNDLTLAPKATLDTDSSRLTVTAAPAASVAAFLVVRRMGGWRLRPLAPLAAAAPPSAAAPARLATYDRPEDTVPAWPSASLAPMYGRISFRDPCAGHWAPPFDRSARRVCDYCRSLSLPSDQPALIGTWNAFVLVVASDVARTPDDWAKVADSAGTVRRLQDLPGRVGRLAFTATPGARWMAVVEEFPDYPC